MTILFGKGQAIQAARDAKHESQSISETTPVSVLKNTDEPAKKDGSLIYKTMAVSFLGSGIAEFLSLAFYYPFDLIKTRMQTVSKGS